MYAIDISHHQKTLPWAKIAHGTDYCIVRATYGTMRDKLTQTHLTAARANGMKVGVYHFYRPSQPAAQQLAVFRQAVSESGYAIGDVIPTIDIEADPFPRKTEVKPSWQASVKLMLDAMVSDFGDCMVYITQREFRALGSPSWILDRPLWVAHYTVANKPATPGNKQCIMWQHRVGPFVLDGPGGYNKARPELDQNRVFDVLPTATRVPWQEDTLTFVEEDDQSDDGWDEACADAIANQFDVLDIIHDEAMDELTGKNS